MAETDLLLWDAWVERRDEHAFETVVRPHLAFARDFAGRMAADPADADDAVQQALTRLALDRSRRPVEVGLRAWLGRTVGLEVKMLARARGRRRRHEAAALPAGGAPPPDPTGPHAAVDRALADLPEAQRVAVVLHFLHDVEYPELAAVLGASEAACRVRVHRGIETLRRRLGAGAAALVASLPLLRGRTAEAAIPAATAAAASGVVLPALVGALAMNKTALIALTGVLLAGGAAASVAPWSEGEPVAPPEPPTVAQAPAETGASLRGSSPVEVPAPAVPRAPVASEAPAAAPPASPSADLAAAVLAAGGTVRVGGGKDVKSAEEIGGRPIIELKAKYGGAVAWLSRIGEAPGLERLVLAMTPTGDADVAALPALPSLREIDLDRTAITAAAIPHLVRLTGLRKVIIGHTKALGDGLEGLDRLPGLTELVLQGSKVTDADLVHVGRLTRLVRLDIHDTLVTDGGLANLRGLTSLRYLKVHETRVTGRGFAELRGLALLEDIELQSTRTDDAGLAALARLPHLQELHLEQTDVTDAGLAHLRGHAMLDELDLRKKRVTGAGLTHLEGILTLRSLDLKGTAVTDAAVERLKSALPQLKVRR